MNQINSLQPLPKDLFFKITILKSMMYCGVLWGLYHQQGWAMMSDHEDFIFPEDLHQYRLEVRQISKIIKDKYTYKPYRILRDNKIVLINHILKIIYDKNQNFNIIMMVIKRLN